MSIRTTSQRANGKLVPYASSFASGNLVTWTANNSIICSANDYLKVAYKFNTGALTTDSIGSNTLTNNNTVGESASGKDGYCADIERDSSQYFSITSLSTDLKPSTKMSVAFWMKMESQPGDMSPFGATNVSGHGFFIDTWDTGASAHFYTIFHESDGTQKVIDTTATMSAATWYHMTVICDGSNIIQYLNATPISSTAYDGTIAQWNAIYLGNKDGSAYPFDGLIDEFYFWNGAALSPAQITALYNSGTGSFWKA